MRHLTFALFSFFAIAMGLQANGLIDFEFTPAVVLLPGDSMTTQGFVLSLSGGADVFASIPNGCISGCATNGSRTMAIYNGGVLSLSLPDGSLFSLYAFDIAGTLLDSDRNVTTIGVLGWLPDGGNVSVALAVNDPNSFSSLTLPSSFDGLVSADFYSLAPVCADCADFQLDNISANANPTPEPETALLALCGVLAVMACSWMSGFHRTRALQK
jgi:hypothetical protein